MKKRFALKPRKQPRQERSRQMRDDLVEAATRVLSREGALRFTTTRGAEVAGVSVGSLYQYFPNKQALAFAIHQRSVEQAWAEVQRILAHPRWRPRVKVRHIARLYFVAEATEVAEMGAALQEAEIFFADEPEHRRIDRAVADRFAAFVAEALPRASPARIAFATRMLITVLESVGRSVARMGLPAAEVRRWSDDCAQMVCDHLGLP